MKNITKIVLLPFLFLWAACSEDLNPSPELAGPLYGLEKGAPGSLEELIYNTWEYCGVYYLYDYSETAFQVSNWSGFFNKWYTPVKEEHKELVRTVIQQIQEGVFAGMDADFIRRNWFVRVFLCDSLCDGSTFNADKLIETYLENKDMLIIPNVGEKMKNYTEEEWTQWIDQFSTLLISRLYLGATEEPTDFFGLRAKDPRTGKELSFILGTSWVEDPESEYSPNVYTFRTNGYIKSQANFTGPETIFVPDKQQDVFDYITFLTTTAKTEIEHVFERFPKILERTVVLLPYLKNILGLDLVAMQQANCPEDAVGADFFENLQK